MVCDIRRQRPARSSALRGALGRARWCREAHVNFKLHEASLSRRSSSAWSSARTAGLRPAFKAIVSASSLYSDRRRSELPRAYPARWQFQISDRQLIGRRRLMLEIIATRLEQGLMRSSTCRFGKGADYCRNEPGEFSQRFPRMAVLPVTMTDTVILCRSRHEMHSRNKSRVTCTAVNHLAGLLRRVLFEGPSANNALESYFDHQ